MSVNNTDVKMNFLGEYVRRDEIMTWIIFVAVKFTLSFYHWWRVDVAVNCRASSVPFNSGWTVTPTTQSESVWAPWDRPHAVADADSNFCHLKSGSRARARLTIWVKHLREMYTSCLSALCVTPLPGSVEPQVLSRRRAERKRSERLTESRLSCHSSTRA